MRSCYSDKFTQQGSSLERKEPGNKVEYLWNVSNLFQFQIHQDSYQPLLRWWTNKRLGIKKENSRCSGLKRASFPPVGMSASNMTNYSTSFPPPSTPKSFSLAYSASTSAFTIFLILGTIFGNVLVIVAFSVFHRIRTVTNCFLVSLACTDLCVAIFSMPIWTVYLLTGPGWLLDHLLTKIWTIADILLGTASIVNLTVISLDRLICIKKPMVYPQIMTPSKVRTALVLIWLYSFLLALISYFFWNFALFNFIVSILSFFLPLVFIIIAYVLIFKVALRQTRCIHSNLPDQGLRARPSRYNFLKELKAAKTLAVVVGCFVVCWCPFVVLNMIYSLCVQCPIVNPNVILVTKWMHYGNSLVNPLIYACMNKDFRISFKKLLTHCMTASAGKQFTDFQMTEPNSMKRSNSTRCRDAS